MVRPWNHLSRANNVQMTRTGRMTIVETTAMMIASEDGRCMGGEWGATISRRVSFSRNSTPQERRKQEKSRTVESKAKEGDFSVVGLGGRRVGVVDGVRAGMCKFWKSVENAKLGGQPLDTVRTLLYFRCRRNPPWRGPHPATFKERKPQ